MAYLTNSFTHFIDPRIGARLFPFLLPAALGEVAFGVALLTFGVDAHRWTEQARGRTLPPEVA